MPEKNIPTRTMDRWNDTELLAHIQRFTSHALEMVDGTDPNAPDRIDHAKDQIQQAVDILQARDYPFEYKAREKLPFVNWLPTNIDMRLMVRHLVKGDHPPKGMHPNDYKVLLAPQGDTEATVRQYRAIGEILIEQAVRQGTSHNNAVQAWLQQVPNALKGGCIEMPLPSTASLWEALGEHLRHHPETQISMHCTLPQRKAAFINIRDLITPPRKSRQSAEKVMPHNLVPNPAPGKTPQSEPTRYVNQQKINWVQRIFNLK